MNITDIFTDPVIVALTAIIQFIVIVIGVMAVRGLNALAKKANISIDNEIGKELGTIIDNIVIMINQTIVDKIKETSLTGKLTQADSEQIYSKVFSTISDILSSEQIAYLEEKYSSVENALKILIEASVAANKKSLLIPIHCQSEIDTTDVNRDDINIDIPVDESTDSE